MSRQHDIEETEQPRERPRRCYAGPAPLQRSFHLGHRLSRGRWSLQAVALMSFRSNEGKESRDQLKTGFALILQAKRGDDVRADSCAGRRACIRAVVPVQHPASDKVVM